MRGCRAAGGVRNQGARGLLLPTTYQQRACGLALGLLNLFCEGNFHRLCPAGKKSKSCNTVTKGKRNCTRHPCSPRAWVKVYNLIWILIHCTNESGKMPPSSLIQSLSRGKRFSHIKTGNTNESFSPWWPDCLFGKHFLPRSPFRVPAASCHSTSYYRKSEQLCLWTNGVVANLFWGQIH